MQQPPLSPATSRLHSLLQASVCEAEEVRLALEEGADVDAPDRQGGTAVIMAIATRKKEIIDLVLPRCMFPDRHDHNGKTALHHASWSCLWRSVSEEEKALCTHIIQRLVARGASVDLRDLEEYGHTPLMTAVQRADLSSITALIAAGADTRIVNDEGQTVENMLKDDTAEEILAFLAPVIAADKLKPPLPEPLLTASQQLIAESRKINPDPGRIDDILACNPDLHETDEYGRTAFLWACRRIATSRGLVQKLIDRKTPLDTLDMMGVNPFLCVMMLGKEEDAKIIEAFVRAGVYAPPECLKNWDGMEKDWKELDTQKFVAQCVKDIFDAAVSKGLPAAKSLTPEPRRRVTSRFQKP